MRRPIALLTAALAVAAPAAKAEKRRHVPGCGTPSCDDRIGARWAAGHPPRARLSSATFLASWYGPGLYGNLVGCAGRGGVPAGQRLTPDLAGVAHKTLPCGTLVRLCRAAARGCAGPTATARVVDRGPYVGGRTFDLTVPVSDAIGASGVTSVRWAAVG